MRVEGLIFADENLIGMIRSDQAPERVDDVKLLPESSLKEPLPRFRQ